MKARSNRQLATGVALSREQRLAGAVTGADWSLRGKREWNKEIFENIDWEWIPLLGRQHKIRPMMAAALREAKWPSVPNSVRDQVETDETACMRKTLTQLSTLASIAASAGKLGIRFLTLKGPGLSRYLYNNPLIRESFDLDLLVHPSDLSGMTELLAREKVFPVFAPPLTPRQTTILRRFNKHDSFMQAGSGLIVECHYGLDHNPGRITADFEDLWRGRNAVVVAGEVIALPGGKQLTHYLCVHAARHCWDRWKWLGDIAALCRLAGEKEIEEYREWARVEGNLDIFDASLLLTTEVTGVQLPAVLNQEANSNRNAKSITKRTLRLSRFLSLLRKRSPEQSRPSRLYLFKQLIERLRQKKSLTCIWHEAAVLAHYPQDWYAYRLPDRMIWSYYVLRIVSILGGRISALRATDGQQQTEEAVESDQTTERRL